jgi:hypothetical protein
MSSDLSYMDSFEETEPDSEPSSPAPIVSSDMTEESSGRGKGSSAPSTRVRRSTSSSERGKKKQRSGKQAFDIWHSSQFIQSVKSKWYPWLSAWTPWERTSLESLDEVNSVPYLDTSTIKHPILDGVGFDADEGSEFYKEVFLRQLFLRNHIKRGRRPSPLFMFQAWNRFVRCYNKTTPEKFFRQLNIEQEQFVRYATEGQKIAVHEECEKLKLPCAVRADQECPMCYTDSTPMSAERRTSEDLPQELKALIARLDYTATPPSKPDQPNLTSPVQPDSALPTQLVQSTAPSCNEVQLLYSEIDRLRAEEAQHYQELLALRRLVFARLPESRE